MSFTDNLQVPLKMSNKKETFGSLFYCDVLLRIVLIFLFLLCHEILVIYKVSLNLLNIHVTVEMVKLVTDGSCKEFLALYLILITIKVHSPGYYMIGSGYDT